MLGSWLFYYVNLLVLNITFVIYECLLWTFVKRGIDLQMFTSVCGNTDRKLFRTHRRDFLDLIERLSAVV